AYISDVELLDGFPAKTAGYYSRLHRWTRGDWQTIPWLFRRVRREDGSRGKNPLNGVSRLKIFDNLARSLSPVFTALAVAAAAFSAKYLAAAAAAAVCFSADFLLCSAERAVRRVPRGKSFSSLAEGFSGELTRMLARFILLGHTAFVLLSAVVTALYRMLISRRALLEWITATEADKNAAAGLAGIYRSMAASAALGIMMLVFSPYPLGSALGAVWALAPLFAWDLSRKRTGGGRDMPQKDKAFLLESAADMWAYFKTYITAEDNYLPPDNRQEQPAAGVAHRTSPTNIGLAMLSAVSACELGICAAHEAVGVIENIICTLERLPKWHGHISNWYDTRTLRPLQPEYISTVDSGNLAGALAAVKSALKKYAPEDEKLSSRAEKLYRDMDFSFLYDKKKKLFYIGVSLPDEKPTEGWYDLMASEARLASYIAVSKGEAERRHWQRLGRALTEYKGRRGMISWTGTMFEYLMPALLMPVYRDSLIWESLKFCVFVQKSAAKGGRPWGESESAFFAFDGAMNYSYKAHGVQLLALKRGMDRDSVLAPYASYLALEADAPAAVKNLRRFDGFGMRGRFGYYDALDFTRERLGSAEYEPVRTYMAHHLGMSLVSVCNALCSGTVKRFFMQDSELSAYAELLKEKAPAGRTKIERRRRQVPEKPARAAAAEPEAGTITAGNVSRPLCTALSNGAYSVAAAESGMTRSVWNGLLVTDFEPRENSARGGMALYLVCEDKTIPLLPYIALSDSAWAAELSGEFCSVRGRHGNGLESEATVFVSKREAGEIREIRIKNTGKTGAGLKLRCAFEPVMARAEEFEAHPAFAKLRLEAKKEGGAALIKRRAGKAEEEDVFLAFGCDMPMRCCMSRSVFPARGGPRAFCTQEEIPESENGGADVFITAEAGFTLGEGEEKTVKFALACAFYEQDALAACKRLLIEERDTERGQSGLSREDMETAGDILFFRPAGGEVPCEHGRGLWKCGISGDLPVALCRVNGENDCLEAEKALETHERLKRRGLEYDLAFLTGEPPGYRRPLRAALRELIRSSGADENARGGAHLPEDEGECGELIAANACASERFPVPDRRERLETSARGGARFSFENGETFVFSGKDALPPKVWSLPLANKSFGYIAADTGLGHMWYVNSRENKITPWINRPFGVHGGERLTFAAEGRRYSLFADNDGAEYTVCFEPGCAVWEKRINGSKIRTTAFVPPETAARVLIIEAEGLEPEIEWEAALFPRSGSSGSTFTKVFEKEDVLYASPQADPEFEQTLFSLRGSAAFENHTPLFGGRYDGENVRLSFESAGKLVMVCGCDSDEKLEALKDPEWALAELERTKVYWRKRTGVFRIKTPEPELDAYINAWALYQLEASRLLARSSVYQCGGAYGFRDQLQDACALAAQRPETLAEYIKLACRHQFLQGDVQHWWHPDLTGEPERGVRTRCSDDLLWLPYALWVYRSVTGDDSLLDEGEEYISSPPL
ncbi:MAG: hypothetical protein II784_01110, partial [Oscillospiraceae bacterium]|nr:hypothetical protein [Oscillospiraceae bacterium]